MEPSFSLSKRGRIWWASTTLPTGNTKDWTTGEYSRDEAEKKASKWCQAIHRASRAGMKGGKMHGRHRSQRKQAVAKAVEAADLPVARGPKPLAAKKKTAPPVADDAPELAAAEDPPGPAADPSPPPTAGPEGTRIDPERAKKIAEQLRSLGDAPDPGFDEASSSAATDGSPEYIEPGAARAEQEPGENEAGDLLADIIALGAVAGFVKLVNMRCKSSKPPRRAGEPNEKMLEWAHFGARHHLRRLIGTSGTLGPTGKMLVGFAGIAGTMLWGSEVIDPPAGAAAAQPKPQQATNGVHRDPPEAPPPTPPPATSTEIVGLGRFV